ncbi:MAG: [protein-PII] uridylyltransferase [Rhodospirillales bacterium]|nr:[protein-PII] uridylyltransferase [Rhodospirillales bacterium]
MNAPDARPEGAFDWRALSESMARLGRDDRKGVLELAKRACDDGRDALCRRLDAGASGGEIVAARTSTVDRLLRVLLDHAANVVYPEPNPTTGSRLSLVATGGYGRGDLAPHSDIDILFLHPYKLTGRSEQIVEHLLYMLWDLGFSVGHATRSVADCLRRARDDMTIRTSVLESRHVWGDDALYDAFRRRFLTELVPGTEAEFVAAKLRERDERHVRTGNSRYLLEPNVKDGKGGLRDLHVLFWIAKYLFRVDRFGELVGRGVLSQHEYDRFARAEDFLWRVRAHLHVVCERAEDRLTFDRQPEIAARMGYGPRRGNLAVERFMKHYFLVAKSVGELTRVFCAVLEAERLHAAPVHRSGTVTGPLRDGLFVSGGRIAAVGEDTFTERPARLVTIFRRAQTEGRDIHPATLRLIHQGHGLITAAVRDDPEANRAFRAILTDERNPEQVLRMMNEAGVMGRILPDFGRVVGQTQLDLYHVYTVDEHSIRAIGVLSAIERGALADELPLASTLVHQLRMRDVLYLALLLHDVAKGRGGDHSEIGADIARDVAIRLEFTPDEAETVVWLVRWHLLFSLTAFKRDPNDPRTVDDFVGRVRSLERLRLLLVLTAADITAVGPGRMTAWKASLLRMLYHRAEAVLAGGREAEDREARVAMAREKLRARLADWSEADVADFEERLPVTYWLSTDGGMQERHARLVQGGGRGPLVDTRIDRTRDATEMTLYTPDYIGLFAAVAGAVATTGASIVDARVFTTSDGMAIDTIWIQAADGGAIHDEERLARLKQRVVRALSEDGGGARSADEAAFETPPLPARTAAIALEPHVLVDNGASTGYTVVEVSARDRPGLLYDITRTLSACGVSIGSAHISTVGSRAVDVFYVRDRFGLKLATESQIAQVQGRLAEMLGREAEDAPGRRAAAG